MPVRGGKRDQYYQLRDLFPDCAEKLAFVAENGALVKDREELVFAASIPGRRWILWSTYAGRYPEVKNVLCGLHSAYCQRGTVSQAFFDLTHIYYHRLQWVDDFKAVEDQILKFAPTVPEKRPGTTTTCSAAGWRAGSSPPPAATAPST